MKKLGIILLGLCLGVQAIKAQEENIIAVSVYNFTKYIDWPGKNDNNKFYIDVLGHQSVYEKLKQLTLGRKVGNRDIVVRSIQSASEITSCQILFLGFWHSKYIKSILDKIGNAATLVITEKDGLIDDGSGINFVIRNQSIKFEIKKANIVKHGLLVSDALEQMAFKSY